MTVSMHTRRRLLPVLAFAIALLLPSVARAADPRLAGVTAEFSTVYSFQNYPAPDARTPSWPGLIQATDGRLYGAGMSGGSCSNGGGVYSIGLTETQASLVRGFPCDDNNQFIAGEGLGFDPYRGGIADGGDGWLYGTTYNSYDASAMGDVYRVNAAHQYQIVHRWSIGDAPESQNHTNTAGNVYPAGRILLASDGDLYGVTTNGGRCGTGSLYRLTGPSRSFQSLYSFCHVDGVDAVGTHPLGGLVQGPDGAFYGTTQDGGAAYGNNGTVYRLTVDANGVGAVQTLHSFNGSDGDHPEAPLTVGPEGNLYGTTARGNSNNNGTIFAVAPDGSGFRVVHEFGNDWGKALYSGVTFGPGGFIYGTTWSGGAANCGTVIAVDPAAAPDDHDAVNYLHSFNCTSEGTNPIGALVAATDGNFYGTTEDSGLCGSCGTIFRAHFTAPPATPIDTTPPTVTCGSPDGAWHADDVSIACTAADSGSGLKDPADSSFTLRTGVPAGSADPNAATGSRLVCDTLLNCVQAGPIPGNKVDKQPPEASIASPSGSYVVGSSVSVDYTCVDHSGSGIASCTAPLPSGDALDTSHPTTGTLTVIATDNAGNTATAVSSYSIVDVPPTVEIQSPTPGTYPAGHTFDLTSSFVDPVSGRPHTCTISWGDGSSQPGVVDETAHTCAGSHVYGAPGARTITVRITDDGGFGSDTVTVDVDAPPVARITTSPPAPLTGDVVTLDGSASSDPDGPIVSFHWTFDDGGSASGPVVSHAFGTSGSHTATLVVSDGIASDSASATIQVGNRPPIADLSFTPVAPSTADSVDFDASLSSDPDGAIVSYAWTYGDGSTGEGMTSAHAYATAGSYVVKLTVTDDAGAVATATKLVTVANRPPTASFTVSNDAPAAGDPVVLDGSASSDPDGTIVSYAWTFGDGTTGTGPTPTHAYGAVGTYTASLRVTDDRGATDQAIHVLRVSAVVPPPVTNRPPVCSTARPSRALWPPNHKWVDVAIVGVSDPDGDGITIKIVSIRQDEPLDRLGDGSTTADGMGIGSAVASVRAERSGLLNGRVYTIGFSASDGKGGGCSGTVLVGIPHDQGSSAFPVDDGPRYDSTKP